MISVHWFTQDSSTSLIAYHFSTIIQTVEKDRAPRRKMWDLWQTLHFFMNLRLNLTLCIDKWLYGVVDK